MGACTASTPTHDPATLERGSRASEAPEIIRWVTWQEWPSVFAACMGDGGFPASGVAPDGSAEYGPYNQAQNEDFERADALCQAQYPITGIDDRTSSRDDVIASYEYQRDEWVPCMKRELGIDLGEMPSRESFLANPVWVDLATFTAETERAVSEGRLENVNAWWPICPDWDAMNLDRD